MKNYGLQLDPLVPEDLIFGSDQSLGSRYGAEVLIPDGDWTGFLPPEEDQSTRTGDTFACVSYGTANAIELLSNRVFGDRSNLSDRFIANLSGTKVGYGNTPKTVASFIRHNWSVYESEWPDVDTVEEFYAAIPEKLKTLAIARGAEYEFGYEYVSATQLTIKEALKYSPICVSVPAWFEKDGTYYRPKGMNDNHWTTIVKILPNGNYLAYDSFPPFRKELKPECIQVTAMRYYLKRQVQNESWWASFIRGILDWINGVQPTPAPIVPEPTPEHPSKREQLYKAAKDSLGRDISPSDNAPDELACAESVCAVIQKVQPFPTILSTIELNKYLRNSKNWKSTLDLKPGNVIISPTGSGNGNVPYGHTGIYLENDFIASNDSTTGKWSKNYSTTSWVNRYRKVGGFPIYVYELV